MAELLIRVNQFAKNEGEQSRIERIAGYLQFDILTIQGLDHC